MAKVAETTTRARVNPVQSFMLADIISMQGLSHTIFWHTSTIYIFRTFSSTNICAYKFHLEQCSTHTIFCHTALNPQLAGVFGQMHHAGGGGRFCPPLPNSRMMAVARRARWQSKSPDEYLKKMLLKGLESFLKISLKIVFKF